MFGILDQSISRVFKAAEIKNKDGNVIGAAMTFKTRKEMAAEFDLAGKAHKDELDVAILKESDEAFRKAKAHIAGLNGDTTLTKFAVRTLSSGIVQTTMVTRAIPRTHGPSDEAISKALGITTEEVQAMRERQKAALAATVEV
jgi:hypothetical protein